MIMSIPKRITILSITLTIFTLLNLQAQTLNGKIISKPGGEPVPFASVIVKGSTLGVASDQDGRFAITIPSIHKNGTIMVSAVGYKDKEMPISDLNDLKENIIVISAQNYNIDEVDVEAESKVLYGAIKKCSKSIADNYITTPYSCDFTYTNNEKSANGIYTDITGYQRTTFKGSYRKIRYQFNPSENKESNIPFFEGKTNMEDLLSFDLVRTVGNVIDEQNVYDFDLSLIPNKEPDLWVIHFKAKDPQLYNTGDAQSTSYEGELYILKHNYAINKIVVRGTSSKRSIHGKSIAVSDESSNYITDLKYEVTIIYKTKKDKLRLDKIVMSESFNDIEGQAQTAESTFEITQQLDNVVDIEDRDYFIK